MSKTMPARPQSARRHTEERPRNQFRSGGSAQSNLTRLAGYKVRDLMSARARRENISMKEVLTDALTIDSRPRQREAMTANQYPQCQPPSYMGVAIPSWEYAKTPGKEYSVKPIWHPSMGPQAPQPPIGTVESYNNSLYGEPVIKPQNQMETKINGLLREREERIEKEKRVQHMIKNKITGLSEKASLLEEESLRIQESNFAASGREELLGVSQHAAQKQKVVDEPHTHEPIAFTADRKDIRKAWDRGEIQTIQEAYPANHPPPPPKKVKTKKNPMAAKPSGEKNAPTKAQLRKMANQNRALAEKAYVIAYNINSQPGPPVFKQGAKGNFSINRTVKRLGGKNPAAPASHLIRAIGFGSSAYKKDLDVRRTEMNATLAAKAAAAGENEKKSKQNKKEPDPPVVVKGDGDPLHYGNVKIQKNIDMVSLSVSPFKPSTTEAEKMVSPREVEPTTIPTAAPSLPLHPSSSSFSEAESKCGGSFTARRPASASNLRRSMETEVQDPSVQLAQRMQAEAIREKLNVLGIKVENGGKSVIGALLSPRYEMAAEEIAAHGPFAGSMTGLVSNPFMPKVKKGSKKKGSKKKTKVGKKKKKKDEKDPEGDKFGPLKLKALQKILNNVQDEAKTFWFEKDWASISASIADDVCKGLTTMLEAVKEKLWEHYPLLLLVWDLYQTPMRSQKLLDTLARKEGSISKIYKPTAEQCEFYAKLTDKEVGNIGLLPFMAFCRRIQLPDKVLSTNTIEHVFFTVMQRSNSVNQRTNVSCHCFNTHSTMSRANFFEALIRVSVIKFSKRFMYVDMEPHDSFHTLVEQFVKTYAVKSKALSKLDFSRKLGTDEACVKVFQTFQEQLFETWTRFTSGDHTFITQLQLFALFAEFQVGETDLIEKAIEGLGKPKGKPAEGDGNAEMVIPSIDNTIIFSEYIEVLAQVAKSKFTPKPKSTVEVALSQRLRMLFTSNAKYGHMQVKMPADAM
eukprot:CAMPEP_0175131352 /NCGR_PEP_ID=MMETSP0087-20121206/6495_1 /TAXON_ID=136419 /ORGANISM="Unknown Unknown, Strain D1" /LENGTH=968 /DNA_ID=CAMNT_0016413633 /DNA_START=1 /DNA_END=2907 /DNA_ORIENTATION=-